jgi:hypothetical protein
MLRRRVMEKAINRHFRVCHYLPVTPVTGSCRIWDVGLGMSVHDIDPALDSCSGCDPVSAVLRERFSDMADASRSDFRVRMLG